MPRRSEPQAVPIGQVNGARTEHPDAVSFRLSCRECGALGDPPNQVALSKLHEAHNELTGHMMFRQVSLDSEGNEIRPTE